MEVAGRDCFTMYEMMLGSFSKYEDGKGLKARCYLRSSLGCSLVWAVVIKATEDLEGGITIDVEGLAEIGLFCTVNFGKLDLLLDKSRGSLLIFGGKFLAVTAPGSVDWEVMLGIGVSEKDSRQLEAYTWQERVRWN